MVKETPRVELSVFYTRLVAHSAVFSRPCRCVVRRRVTASEWPAGGSAAAVRQQTPDGGPLLSAALCSMASEKTKEVEAPCRHCAIRLVSAASSRPCVELTAVVQRARRRTVAGTRTVCMQTTGSVTGEEGTRVRSKLGPCLTEGKLCTITATTGADERRRTKQPSAHSASSFVFKLLAERFSARSLFLLTTGGQNFAVQPVCSGKVLFHTFLAFAAWAGRGGGGEGGALRTCLSSLLLRLASLGRDLINWRVF